MKRAILAAVVIAAIGVAAVRVLGRARPESADVTTIRVEKTKFERRVNAEGNLRAVKATRLVAPRGGQFGPLKIAWLARDGMLVKAGEVVTRFDPSDPEKKLRDGKADLASASARLRQEAIKSGAAVAGRDTDAVLARDELEKTQKFQSKDEMIFSRNQIIESQIDEELAGAKQKHAEHAKQIELRLSRSNAAVIDVEQKKATLTISHAQTALNAMQIVAPTDGVFVLERDWRGATLKPGDSLWPGQGVAEIPLLSEMEANVFVLEVDGSGLAEQQAAEIVVEAHPGRVFKGKVRLVDKLAQPRVPGSPVQYFGVAVTLEATDPAIMKPGQRVRATLMLDQAEALVVPRQAVVERERKNVVFRRTSGGFEPVEVELGPATSGRVVVTKGLDAGDVIALRDPTRPLDQAGSGSGSSAREGEAP